MNNVGTVGRIRQYLYQAAVYLDKAVQAIKRADLDAAGQSAVLDWVGKCQRKAMDATMVTGRRVTPTDGELELAMLHEIEEKARRAHAEWVAASYSVATAKAMANLNGLLLSYRVHFPEGPRQ